MCEAMTEYMVQRQRVFKTDASDDFASIYDSSKLLIRIINLLYRDMNIVDAMISQMENFCGQQSIAITSNEAGPSELQHSVDWLRQHFMERASGQ